MLQTYTKFTKLLMNLIILLSSSLPRAFVIFSHYPIKRSIRGNRSSVETIARKAGFNVYMITSQDSILEKSQTHAITSASYLFSGILVSIDATNQANLH